jgi:hypothetical protein
VRHREVKGKAKGRPVTGHEGTKVSRGIALLFPEPRRWMGVGGQRHAPVTLPRAKTQYPLYRRLGEPQDRSVLWV